MRSCRLESFIRKIQEKEISNPRTLHYYFVWFSFHHLQTVQFKYFKMIITIHVLFLFLIKRSIDEGVCQVKYFRYATPLASQSTSRYCVKCYKFNRYLLSESLQPIIIYLLSCYYFSSSFLHAHFQYTCSFIRSSTYINIRSPCCIEINICCDIKKKN